MTYVSIPGQDQIQGVKEFYTYLEVFSKSGENRDGKIKLIGFKRILNFL